MNNYEILGLPRGANSSQVKKRYRELCMIHHPDRGGNPNNFIRIKEAYEAILKGDVDGSQNQNPWKDWTQTKKPGGEFRFVGIKKDSYGYMIRFFLKNVHTATIRGLDGRVVASYGVSHVNGYTNLIVTWEEAKKAQYCFRIRLEDDDKYADLMYVVATPLTKWQKIINKLKFWKK